MVSSKTYTAPGLKVTVELEDTSTIEEICPSENDLIIFVKDMFTMHLRK